MFALVVASSEGFPSFSNATRAEKARSRLLARIDGLLEAIGRRMKPAKSQHRKRGLMRRKLPKSRAAHDWLCVANRAMCVSLGQQIARLKEEHI